MEKTNDDQCISIDTFCNNCSNQVFASAAPDGKTNAADIAQTMGTTAQWNRWEKEWETLKNDWTQISLSPGSNATELNLHGIHQSRQMMIIQMQNVPKTDHW